MYLLRKGGRQRADKGKQLYISCAQITVTGGGSGDPSPLVAIPGVYTGYEPGLLLNIYWPIRKSPPPFFFP
jgi:hypothetical protein